MHSILESHCKSGNFSRGYLLIGNSRDFRLLSRKAASILLKCGEKELNSHPDFSEQNFDLFGIDENRDLREKCATKPLVADKKAFLLAISSFAPEAIKGISKILEESSSNCHFFLLTPAVKDTPPLIRSQLVNILEEEKIELDEEKKNFYKKFLKMEPVERLNSVKKTSGDKKNALEFLNELEIVLADNLKNKNLPAATQKNLISSLEEIQKNRRFLFDRASYPKMIVEHIALTLPQLR